MSAEEAGGRPGGRSPGPLVRLVASGAAHEGRGHVSRALALAEALHRSGARIAIELIRGELTEVERGRIGGWQKAVEGEPSLDPDVVVLDVPDADSVGDRFDPDRLAVFDDGDAFGGRAAIIVQTSLPAWTGPGTAGRVLAGYAYAPIAAAYRRLRETPGDARRTVPGTLPRVVICFGGSDPDDVLGRIGPGLTTDPGWLAEVVVGAGYHGDAESWPTPPVRDPVDLPERLAAADLAVVGVGTMKFEVACLGVPALLLAAADDQLGGAADYAATGAAEYLGDGRIADPNTVRAAVGGLLADHRRRSEMAGIARDLIDGRGADRIAAAVLDLAGSRSR